MSSAPDGPASKRLKLSSESSELDNSQFDEETQKALEEIDKEQLEIDSLNEKVTEEILKVEQRYNKLKQPHYDQRSTLIQRVPKFWANAVSFSFVFLNCSNPPRYWFFFKTEWPLVSSML